MVGLTSCAVISITGSATLVGTIATHSFSFFSFFLL